MAPAAPLPAPNGPLDAQANAQRDTLDELRAKLQASRDARHAAACKFKRATEAAPHTPEAGYNIKAAAEQREREEEDDTADSGVRSMPDPEERLAARRKMLEDSKLVRMRRLRELKAKTMSAVRTVGETTLMNWENELAGEKPELEDEA